MASRFATIPTPFRANCLTGCSSVELRQRLYDFQDLVGLRRPKLLSAINDSPMRTTAYSGITERGPTSSRDEPASEMGDSPLRRGNERMTWPVVGAESPCRLSRLRHESSPSCFSLR